MSRQDVDHWKRTTQLQRAGWRVEPVRTVQPHHGPEIAEHFLLKAALADVIERRGRPVIAGRRLTDTSVSGPELLPADTFVATSSAFSSGLQSQ